ncbi:MAG TPA: DNA replication/repair protein RecF [Sedimenticola sp.]|nr:DNA replication/repair protein RecF [Sedimenticola sp.]
MPLSLLRIHNLRNLQDVELEPSADINVLWGGNGAGKTAILESIFMLGRGRSFRGTETGPLVAEGQEGLEIFGRIEREGRAVETIGIRKKRKCAAQIRLNQENIKKLSILAKAVPLQILIPRSHEILERGSSYRRRLIDWGVFHVEPEFMHLSNRYHQALKQRNAALRGSPKTAFAWDRVIAESGEEMETKRSRYIEKLVPVFREEVSRLISGKEMLVKYKKGWPGGEAYMENLIRRRDDDIRRGFTGSGPHRSDIEIEMTGQKVEKTASRGEQKLVIAALYLAQARVVRREKGIRPVFLIDDLPAELDKEKRELFLNELQGLDTQVFLTGIEKDCFSVLGEKRLFHVEQGRVYRET